MSAGPTGKRRTEAVRLELIEIAPGVDLERDILAQMEFRPDVSPALKLMDARIFLPQPMRLADTIAANRRPTRSTRLSNFIARSQS
jgi:propionate CoA-transferase